jgi:hypothetical protein
MDPNSISKASEDDNSITTKRKQGSYTFFLKYFLENEIFLDNLKFFFLIFSNFDFFISKVDSESLSTLWKIIFKREESKVDG